MIFKMVKYLHDCLVAAQENLEAIKESIRSWGRVPLFQRKDLNPRLLLHTDPRQPILSMRSAMASNTQRLIDLLMYINLKLFFDIPRRYSLPPGEHGEEDEEGDGIWPPIKSLSAMTSVKFKKKRDTGDDEDDLEEYEEEQSESEEEIITPFHRYEILNGVSREERILFREYEKYVDENIAENLVDAVITSSTYLRMEVDNRYENNTPIFEIFMELQEPNVVYFLNLDTSSKTGFAFFIETLLDDMNDMMSLLNRVAQDPSEVTGQLPINFMGELIQFRLLK